jgi:DinB superfamily
MSPIENLLDALDASRERFLVALEPLDDVALLRKNVVGEWSTADIMTNITAWESELATALMKLEQNKRPGKLLQALADPEAYDSERYAEMQDRDLDQVFEDLQQVRVQVEDWISGLSERDLTDPRRYQWLKGRALQEIIAETTYLREEKFLPAVETFVRTWVAEENDLARNTIPVALIEPFTQEESDENTN